MASTVGIYGNVSINACEKLPPLNYTAVSSAVCATCFLFGLLYCFFGYRFFKATMFLTGFLFGALVSYVVIQNETVLPMGGRIGIILAAGLLCGLITMLVQYVGLFMTGFVLGELVAIVVLIIIEQFVHPSSRWIAIGILFGCGVLFALLNLYFQRGLTIIGSSIIGAAAIAVGVDYFVEGFRMLQYVTERIHVEWSVSLCWYSWVLFAVWPVVSLMGIIIQWRLTGKSIDHKESTRIRRPKKLHIKKQRNAAPKVQNKKEVARRPSYRQLYQIRRTNGDIISQSYLDNFAYRQSPDMVQLIRESPNSRSRALAAHMI